MTHSNIPAAAVESQKPTYDDIDAILDEYPIEGAVRDGLREDIAELLYTIWARSRNYTASHDTFPSEVTFANGRVVRLSINSEYLTVSSTDALPLIPIAGGEGGKTFPAADVAQLAKYQLAGRFHPFTCPNRGDGKHANAYGDIGALVATTRGWICPFCDYTQDWAHDFMRQGSALDATPEALAAPAVGQEPVAAVLKSLRHCVERPMRNIEIFPDVCRRAIDLIEQLYTHPAPDHRVDAVVEEQHRDVGRGMAIAAGICAFLGAEGAAEEILQAGGLETDAKLKEAGVEEYDIGLLRGVLDYIAEKSDALAALHPAKEG